MTPEDRKRVEEIRSYCQRGAHDFHDWASHLLAILDRVDPAPPPERIVVSERAREALLGKHARSKLVSFYLADDSRDIDAALLAAFKVMLRDVMQKSMDEESDLKFPMYFGERGAKELYRRLTGEQWPA